MVLVASAGLVACSLGRAAPLQPFLPQLPAQAQAGDLLFRQGTEAVSQLVRSVDAGDFSHVGLLVAPATPTGPWRVVHATPSEKPGQPDAVVLDTLDFYLHPQRARSYQLYRVPASATARQQAVGWALAQQGRAFDLLDAEHGLYCTTLVWQAWQQAGVALEARFTEVMLPFLGGRYLLPGGLRRAPQLQALTPTLPVTPGWPTP